MCVQVQGMWHLVEGNNFQTYRNYSGFQHWAQYWPTPSLIAQYFVEMKRNKTELPRDL